jgi:DNA-directed RNA polymerase specialized sigma subunit
MLETRKKDNAKRQTEYRKRHMKEGSDQRLNVILGLDAKLALERMAKHSGVTNKSLLERVLLEAQSRLLEDMDGEQQTRYYGVKTSSAPPKI